MGQLFEPLRLSTLPEIVSTLYRCVENKIQCSYRTFITCVSHYQSNTNVHKAKNKQRNTKPYLVGNQTVLMSDSSLSLKEFKLKRSCVNEILRTKDISTRRL